VTEIDGSGRGFLTAGIFSGSGLIDDLPHLSNYLGRLLKQPASSFQSNLHANLTNKPTIYKPTSIETPHRSKIVPEKVSSEDSLQLETFSDCLNQNTHSIK
jgi:hypothetical protein